MRASVACEPIVFTRINTGDSRGKLTDDDLTLIEGKRVALIGRLQENYGTAKDQAEKQVDDWLNKIG